MVEDEVVTETASRVVDAAHDDWVQLVEVEGHLVDVAEELGSPLWWPDTGETFDPPKPRDEIWLEKRIELGMRVVETLLRDRGLVPGHLAPWFVKWGGDVDEWLVRIETDWRLLGTHLGLNDVCWFAIESDEIHRTGSSRVS